MTLKHITIKHGEITEITGNMILLVVSGDGIVGKLGTTFKGRRWFKRLCIAHGWNPLSTGKHLEILSPPV